MRRKLTFGIFTLIAVLLFIQSGLLILLWEPLPVFGESIPRQVLVGHAVVWLGCTALAMPGAFAVIKRQLRTNEPIRQEMADRELKEAADEHSESSSEHAGSAVLSEALEQLRSMKEYLGAFVNYTTDAIHVMDIEGKVLEVNKAFEELYGWTAEEVIGKVPRIIPHGLEEEFRRLLNKVKNGGQVNGYETIRRAKNGRDLNVSITLSPIRGEAGNVVAFASITRNITERKQTEELLRRSEKLSVVGQLAAGVAHEIRNPLTTLRGFVQLLQLRGEGNPHHLELMLAELDRINFIVSEFLILSKPQMSNFQIKDLAAIVTDMLQLLETQANLNNIVIHTDIEPELPKIKCEENQLKQVFINVLKNGMEAMPEGGDIRIQVKRVDANRVMLRFIDHGCGIPEEHLARLGEPFFTSKENGNGLGIMVSQQIIANHKGNMLIRSELGKGTCVDIVLPVDF